MNGVLTSVMYYFNQNQIGKENILDPLSTIIKLAILSYKTDYTKIAIRYNAIYLQETSFYQSTVRYLYGDNKNFLHCLKEPIIIACNHYLQDNKDESIQIIFCLAIKGIQKLKHTYLEQKIITSCLEYYELIINSYLENSDLKESFSIEKVREDYSDKIIDSMSEYWTEDNIKMIIHLFENLDRNKDYNLIKVIETFMSSVDISINHIIMNSC